MSRPSRSLISPKVRDFDFYLDMLHQAGIELDILQAHSTAGEIRPERAYQWEAIAQLRAGDDDPLIGVGWTPIEAIRDLYKAAFHPAAPPSGGGSR